MNFKLLINIFLIFLILFLNVCKKGTTENENKKRIGIINSKIGIRFFFEPTMGPNYIQLNPPFGTVVSILESIPPEENRGTWTKIKYQNYVGWIYVLNNSLIETSLVENEVFANNLNGVSVFDSHSTDSKKVDNLEFGKKVRLQTDGFQNPQDYKIYNIVKIDSEYGFVLDEEFTTKFYTKEEIQKGPFVGMEYRGSILNCDSHYASSVSYKREEWSQNYYISREFCGKKVFVIFKKLLRHVGRAAIFEIRNVMDLSQYETDKDKFLVIEQEENEALYCFGNGFINTVTWVDFKKGKKIINPDKSILYENVILKTWVIDPKTENLVEISPEGQKCSYPAPWD
ncbi:hypothetical protein EHQ76_06835 [Leptospira barantonii]|uniref:SH3 domain-containing protein n=1 Tax=Leptospira barantonii TaxID=2023184 RepID=A0A5F2BK72_9LEPT|nr:hypothetical protein [Leptospira barantonii]TGM05976.1 hypothetical protein EHQ76_06835 [Leptospira barantonii]